MHYNVHALPNESKKERKTGQTSLPFSKLALIRRDVCTHTALGQRAAGSDVQLYVYFYGGSRGISISLRFFSRGESSAKGRMCQISALLVYSGTCEFMRLLD